MFLIAALLAFQPAAGPAGSPPEPAPAAAPAQSTGALVGGIISYSRWPTPPRPLRLCLAGATRHALRMSDAQRTAGQSILVRSIRASADAGDCDVLYLGAMSLTARNRMIRAARNQPIVSIIEDDSRCRSGAMFCLVPAHSTFRLNLDAVSRSQVRVDPRVLRIASGEEQGE